MIPYFHIGYPKAASTSLQVNLFSKHPDINFVGLRWFRVNGHPHRNHKRVFQNSDIKSFYYNIIHVNSLDYKSLGTQNIYKYSIKPNLMDTNFINIFSDENLTNSLFIDNSLKAYRLKDIFQDLKIIILIRNQIDIIRSWYDMLPKNPLGPGSSDKIISFKEWVKINFDYINKSFIHGLKYYELISLYVELFGKSNVGIFLLEDWSTHPNQFAIQLSDFMGIDSQITQKLLDTKEENSVNSLQPLILRKFYKNFQKVIPDPVKVAVKNYTPRRQVKSKLDLDVVNQLKVYYKQSNMKLFQEYALPIDQYNYPM